jgi:hypothetical protein
MRQKALLCFVLVILAINVVAQDSPTVLSVRSAGAAFITKMQNWNYYSGETAIAEPDFLKIIGKDEQATLSQKYQAGRNMKKALYWVSLIVSGVTIFRHF